MMPVTALFSRSHRFLVKSNRVSSRTLCLTMPLSSCATQLHLISWASMWSTPKISPWPWASSAGSSTRATQSISCGRSKQLTINLLSKVGKFVQDVANKNGISADDDGLILTESNYAPITRQIDMQDLESMRNDVEFVDEFQKTAKAEKRRFKWEECKATLVFPCIWQINAHYAIHALFPTRRADASSLRMRPSYHMLQLSMDSSLCPFT
ncbi:hypothetical protein BC940DRAFT_80819 [Gongronella butleri]|nr:hypothetical protein BC940DRAFT_80819 [Gongronella butleri]